jgi:catalase
VEPASFVEQQFVVNAMRFETSQLTSDVVKQNVLIQLNRVSHDVSVRVAESLGMTAPDADDTYYHENTTMNVGPSGGPLLKLDGLKVGLLTTNSASSNNTAQALKSSLGDLNVGLVIVAPRLAAGIDQTYSATSAVQFDAIIVDGSADSLFAPAGNLANSNSTMGAYRNQTAGARSTLYPAGRPLQILQDSYHWGKPVGVLGSGKTAFDAAGIQAGTPGVYDFASSETSKVVDQLAEGLRMFKFLDRYPLDQ